MAEPVTVYGFWRWVLLQVQAGSNTPNKLRKAIHMNRARMKGRTKSTLRILVRIGLLETPDEVHYRLTGKGLQELRHG